MNTFPLETGATFFIVFRETPLLQGFSFFPFSPFWIPPSYLTAIQRSPTSFLCLLFVLLPFAEEDPGPCPDRHLQLALQSHFCLAIRLLKLPPPSTPLLHSWHSLFLLCISLIPPIDPGQFLFQLLPTSAYGGVENQFCANPESAIVAIFPRPCGPC